MNQHYDSNHFISLIESILEFSKFKKRNETNNANNFINFSSPTFTNFSHDFPQIIVLVRVRWLSEAIKALLKLIFENFIWQYFKRFSIIRLRLAIKRSYDNNCYYAFSIPPRIWIIVFKIVFKLHMLIIYFLLITVML